MTLKEYEVSDDPVAMLGLARAFDESRMKELWEACTDRWGSAMGAVSLKGYSIYPADGPNDHIWLCAKIREIWPPEHLQG